MLKRLRWKFTLILMLLLCGVLAAVLVVQTASSLRQYRAGTDQVLQSVLRRTQAVMDPWGSSWDGSLDRDEGLYTTIPAFCAVVDGNGQIVLALAYNAAVDQGDVTLAVNAALAGSGRTPCPGWACAISSRTPVPTSSLPSPI